jgi:3-oxoadipate enol-lactonase
MPHVSVNGAQVHVEDTGVPPGRPDAPTVFFGHGLLFSGRMFAAQVERLRDRYRCVTIDWRGQGKSPAADGLADMDTLSEDALAVIEQLGLGVVHYVGLSMGGFVGMRLAARHPQVIRSLVLLDTSAGPEDPEKVSRYRLLAKVYGVLGMRPVRGRVEPIMFGPTFLADPASLPHRQAWMSELAAAGRTGIKKAIYGVTDREAIADELHRISAPTLVVVGADDVATPVAKAEAIAAAIPGARLEVVADAGHSSTIEQPEALSDLIEAFVDQH